MADDLAKVVLSFHALSRVFKQSQDFSIFTGGISYNFGLPQFVVVRKSMAEGSFFSCQNQLIGAMRCIVAAMELLKDKLRSNLPAIAYGMGSSNAELLYRLTNMYRSRVYQDLSHPRITDWIRNEIQNLFDEDPSDDGDA